MRRVVVRCALSCVLALPVLSVGCRPLLDGGWEGSARCNGDDLPVSAIFNETDGDELEGTVYIEQIFGLIAKGTIDGGGFDPESNSYDFQLQTDNDAPPEFDIELEYAKDDIDELEGTAQILNDGGDVQDTCDINLDRVTLSDD